MPDLKTEMSKVLNAWEQDETDTLARPKVVGPDGRVVFGVTNNVSRETFNFVKNNPAQTHLTVTEALGKRGFKKTSVASLLTQFVKQGMISRDADGTYSAEVDAYSPLKSTKKLRAEGKLKTKPKAKAKVVKVPRSAGIAALKVVPTTINTSSVATAWDAETVINNIGLKQAHELYRELSTYFGG